MHVCYSCQRKNHPGWKVRWILHFVKKRGGAVLVEEESVGVGDIDSESVGEFRGAASA